MVRRRAAPLLGVVWLWLALAADATSASAAADEVGSPTRTLLHRHHEETASAFVRAASSGASHHHSHHHHHHHALANAGNGEESDEDLLPEVRHLKAPGHGYEDGSPLFRKQQYTLRTPQALRPVKPASPSGAAPPIVAPVSTSMLCIVNLVALFFIVYTLVFVVQTLNQLKIINREQEQKSLGTVADTVLFVPMLCILFLATRIRAVHISQGDPDKYDLPQWWVKDAMIVASWATIALTVCVFVITALFGDIAEARFNNQERGFLFRFLFACRTGCTFLIYLGSTLVCVGICVMPAPTELWGVGVPPLSATVHCTIVLCIIYFAVYLALASARASNEAGMLGPPQRFHPAQELLKSAAMTVAFVPMLCLLFITARLWALKINFRDGEPEEWVQSAFYVCTASIVLQVVFAVLGAAANEQDGASRSANGGDQEDNVEPLPGKRGPAALIEALRLCAVICLYLGVFTIVIGLIRMRHPGGHHVAAGDLQTLSPVLFCIILLTTLYFAVYLVFWIVLLMMWNRPPKPDAEEGTDRLTFLRIFLELRAREAVRFCPILCILFLTTSMRAVQVSHGRGEPDGWVLGLLQTATYCTIFLTFVRVDTAFRRVPTFVTSACVLLQYICLVVLYAAAIGLVYALFTMTAADTTAY